MLEGDALRVELGCSRAVAAELVTQLAAARGECELYINEVGTTGAAYEEMQVRSYTSRSLNREVIFEFIKDRFPSESFH